MSTTSPLASTEKKLHTPIELEPLASTATPTSSTEKPPAVDLEYTPAIPTPIPLAKPATPTPATEPAAPATPLPAAKSTGGPVCSPATVDVSSWPMPVLERNALALRGRLASDPKSVSKEERDLLARIEAEITERDAAVPELPSKPPPKTGVQVCSRPVDIPVAEYTGLPHKWLKTSSKEVGMGPKGGGVPGHAGGRNGYPLGPTSLNDHTGEHEGVLSVCTDVPDVDEDCVDRELEIGKPTGPWVPSLNDCHTTVDRILDKCKVRPAPSYVEADAGVP